MYIAYICVEVKEYIWRTRSWYISGSKGALQAGAQEGGAPGAAHKVQERAGQEVPRRADQRAKEGVQRVS